MANESDGGPAFPTCVSADNEGGLSHGDPGMSLRDWFAGQALAGVIYRPEFEVGGWFKPEKAARRAYELADAMLQARTATETIDGHLETAAAHVTAANELIRQEPEMGPDAIGEALNGRR